MSKFYNFNPLKAIIGVTLMTAALGLSACSGPVHPDVKARQDIMKNYGDAMKSIGGMVKEPDTFDAELLKEQASFLAEESKNPWVHFEDKEAVGNAKEAVWTNMADFKAKAEDFQQASVELNSVAQTATSADDIKAAVGGVGKSCKSCHDDYQVDKDD